MRRSSEAWGQAAIAHGTPPRRRGGRRSEDDRLLHGRLMHAFDVLGDPVRRRILEQLATGELTSGAITDVVRPEFGISQPAVSQHLRVLRDTASSTSALTGPAGTTGSTQPRCVASTPGSNSSGAFGSSASTLSAPRSLVAAATAATLRPAPTPTPRSHLSMNDSGAEIVDLPERDGAAPDRPRKGSDGTCSVAQPTRAPAFRCRRRDTRALGLSGGRTRDGTTGLDGPALRAPRARRWRR